ncbi:MULTISPECIES: site-specific integrase [unclassified Desulfovibrio]|uniref:tyrosine-type recombinase/integrase n=1 Tax=unclassified Desulfovibrio TaxID=2593640 RepID=UPI0013EC4AA0|nr:MULTISPECIES: site-specific integrase [unclassified Desulfovibrio]
MIGELMVRIEHFRPRRRALSLRLAALTFVRPGELATAAWEDISLEGALWRIPAQKMKMKRAHQVPLSRQAVDAFRELHDLTARRSPWCFPRRGDPTRPEGAGCLTHSLRCMGYDGQTMTGHGFRAMAATTLSEQAWPSEVIERQLAHIDRNQVRAAYQRSELVEERRRMCQAWADWLDMQWARSIVKEKKKGGQ